MVKTEKGHGNGVKVGNWESVELFAELGMGVWYEFS